MAKKRTFKKNEIVVTFVKHFSVEDESCRGEYYDSEVLINDKPYVELGGYDSEFGDPNAYFAGFVEGLEYLNKHLGNKLELLQIETQKKPDYDGF